MEPISNVGCAGIKSLRQWKGFGDWFDDLHAGIRDKVRFELGVASTNAANKFGVMEEKAKIRYREEQRRNLLAEAKTGSPDSSLVYFLTDGTGIKIGRSRHPEDRLRTLQIGHPLKLSLIKTVAGGKALESALHKTFAADRIKGEWFNDTPELRVYISGIELSKSVPEIVQDPTRH